MDNNGTSGSSLVRNAKILVVGAGGLGCEILKNLAMSEVVRDVVVMDLGEVVSVCCLYTWYFLLCWIHFCMVLSIFIVVFGRNCFIRLSG